MESAEHRSTKGRQVIASGHEAEKEVNQKEFEEKPEEILNLIEERIAPGKRIVESERGGKQRLITAFFGARTEVFRVSEKNGGFRTGFEPRCY